MKSLTIATILGLAATSMAGAAPATGSTVSTVELCNDFHGGKPCTTNNNVESGTCYNVADTNKHYVSSVEIKTKGVTCTFYNGSNCGGKSIRLTYPGSDDLADNNKFDNEILSYKCQ